MDMPWNASIDFHWIGDARAILVSTHYDDVGLARADDIFPSVNQMPTKGPIDSVD